MSRTPIIASLALATLVTAAPAAAGTLVIDAAPAIAPDSGDTGWLLAASAIAMLTALPGVLLLLGGAAGRATLTRTVPAAVASVALATLLYVVIGYSLSFGIGGNDWIGWAGQAMLNAMGTVRDTTTVAETAFVLMQAVPVMLAVTLLAGWLAPRAGRGWLLAFSGLWSLIVLTPLMRWTWGGGWLEGWGALDGAGGVTILYAAAVSAVVALALIGKPEGEAAPQPDGGVQLAGAALFLVGMMALAGGSTIGAGDNAAVAMLSMLLAASVGALTSAALSRNLDAATLARGIGFGVAGIAAAGDGVSMGGAWMIALAAVLAAHFGPRFVPQRLRWQDAGGMALPMASAAKTGGFLFAVFLSFEWFGGSGYPEGSGMTDQLVAQLLLIVATALWAAVGTAIVALSVGLVLPMRRPD